MIKPYKGTFGPITVGTALTTLFTFAANGMAGDTGIEITNTGGTALSDFQILIRLASGGSYHSILAAADWAAILAGGALPDFLNSMGLVNPATLAAAGVAWFGFDPSGIESVELQAAVASGTTTVTGLFLGKGDSRR